MLHRNLLALILLLSVPWSTTASALDWGQMTALPGVIEIAAGGKGAVWAIGGNFDGGKRKLFYQWIDYERNWSAKLNYIVVGGVGVGPKIAVDSDGTPWKG